MYRKLLDINGKTVNLKLYDESSKESFKITQKF